MRQRPHRSVPGRAIIGVIALYALVLHAFLGALVPLAPRLDGAVLCAEHAAGTPSDEGQACTHHACCTQVHAVTLPPPHTVASIAAWPRRAAPVLWRAAETVRARAPPGQGISPRGPPAA